MLLFQINSILLPFRLLIINNTTHKVDSAFFKNELNLSEDTLDKFTNAICYDFSGYSKKDKPMFRIFRSLKYLKIHCRDNIDHRKDLNKCIDLMQTPTNLRDYCIFLTTLSNITNSNTDISEALCEYFSKNNPLINFSGTQADGIHNDTSFSLYDCDCNCLKKLFG